MDKHYEFVVDMETGKVLESTDLRFVRLPWIESGRFAEILEHPEAALAYALDKGVVVEMEPTAHFAVTAGALRAHAEGASLPESVHTLITALTDDQIDTVLEDEIDYDLLVDAVAHGYDDAVDKLLDTAGVQTGDCYHCGAEIWSLDSEKTWIDWNDNVVCQLDGTVHTAHPSES